MERIIDAIDESQVRAPARRYKVAPIPVTLHVQEMDEDGNVLATVAFQPVTLYYPFGEHLDRLVAACEAQAPVERQKAAEAAC